MNNTSLHSCAPPTYWRAPSGLLFGQCSDFGTRDNVEYGVWLDDVYQPDAVQADSIEGWVEVRQLAQDVRTDSTAPAANHADEARAALARRFDQTMNDSTWRRGIYLSDSQGELAICRLRGRVEIRRCD